MAKNILFISSYAPPTISGGPKIIYNMLNSLPSDSYSILTSFYNIDSLFAKKGDWLDGKYVFYDKPKASKEDLQALQDGQLSTQLRSLIHKLKFAAKRIKVIRNIIGIPIIFYQVFAIVHHGKKIISEGQVDMLCGFSDYGPALIGTYFLHGATKKPYLIYMLDLYKGSALPFPGGILAKMFEAKIFTGAENIIVTNNGALDYYKNKYEVDITNKMTVIHNSVDRAPYLKLHTPYNPKSPYNIVFTGAIYWAQIRSLKNLIKAIDQMNDLDVKLKIYCPNPHEYLRKVGIVESSRVSISAVAPRDIQQIQCAADILFLPLSWNTKGQAIIDTATPGKLADYLISGKPILIHAPASSYLVKYARDNHFASIVDEEDIKKLQDAIKKILTNREYSKGLIENAKDTFDRNHNVTNNTKTFHSLISQA
ncbi:MAG: glycosyltransferase [Candidatus Colwellbacteria bacterium]|nr:glycosyltransferase [Candidatus Colwellbacteria bacterium]